MMVTAAYRSRMVGFLAIVVALLTLVGCGVAGTGGQANPPTDRAPTAQPTQIATSGASEPTSVATPASHGGPVTDQVSLIDALRKAGATVTPDDTVEQPFLSAAGTQLRVNGADVQVFEYADDAAAQADAAKLTDALAGRGTVMITWV